MDDLTTSKSKTLLKYFYCTACLILMLQRVYPQAFSQTLDSSKNGRISKPLFISSNQNSLKDSAKMARETSSERSQWVKEIEGKKFAAKDKLNRTSENPVASNVGMNSKNSTDDSSNFKVGDTMIMDRSKTNIDFSESLIEGKMKAPSGFYIQARKGQKLTNLIKLRASFRPEMLKSRGLMPEQVN